MKIKTCNILKTALGLALLITLLLSGEAYAASSQTGNRVWDESKGMGTTYTWNSYSFSGFYYNLDDNLGTEQLTISNIRRTIDAGDVSYTTSPIEVSFDYSNFGKYKIIGFMADRYFAGYTVNSVISDNTEISTVGSGQLQRILLDDEDKRVVSEGGTLTLKEGYVLKVKEVDISGGPRQVWVSLLKDGNEVDSSVVGAGNTYVYTKKVGSVSDLPVIAARIESVFRGREVNAAFVRGVFQISDSYIKINSGDRYGTMEITAANANRIAMSNRESLSLSPGNTIDLMGNLKIVVADNSSVLRFTLSAERAGSYEARGTIYPATSEWTPLNFGLNIGKSSVGFYYDMDKGIGTEKLSIDQINGDTIPDGMLTYSTSPQEIGFEYSHFGSYRVIGFMADKYFAGYTVNSVISGNSEISAVASGQLQKVLLDDDSRRVISEGGTLPLKEGYVLKMKEVDVGAGPGQALVVLLKDGVEVDTSVVAGGDTYLFSKKVGSVSDIPIIAIHIESVFRGREVNAAFTKGIFQISSEITPVKSGDTYGLMKIIRVDSGGIEMNNPDSISLSSGSTMDLMGNIKFKVANSNEVRFYPFVIATPVNVAGQLIIDAPARATGGDIVRIKVTAGGASIEGASVAIDSVSGLTDKSGVLNFTLAKTMKGIQNITASKLGYQDASKSIEVQEYTRNALSIDAPSKANQFDTINIVVTFNGTAVGDAAIMYDNVSVGSTGSDGTLKYTLENSGTHTISASKSGYITAARDIDVIAPFTEFKALDIHIRPDIVSTGQNAVFRSNITNVGTKAGTLPVVLIINSTEVDNMSLALAPGNVKEISFTHKISLPPGNYTVEILGQRDVFEVKPAKIIPFYGTAVIAGVVLFVYLLLAKGKKGSNRKIK